MKVTAYVDGDAYAFKSSVAVEKATYWGEGLWTLHSDINDAKSVFDQMVYEIREAYEEKTGNIIEDLIFCFSDKDNFRKTLNADYKGNRAKVRKPIVYVPLVEMIKEEYSCISYPTLEADDVMGIMATKDDGLNKVIISVDKDFNTIPCTFFDTARGEIIHNTKETSFKNLMAQTLTGDITDGYKGAKGVGKVSAKKILDGVELDKMWDKVIKKFESEEEAILNLRMAFILRDGFYNDNTVRIIEHPNELLG